MHGTNIQINTKTYYCTNGPKITTIYFQFILINSLHIFQKLFNSSSGGTVCTAIGKGVPNGGSLGGSNNPLPPKFRSLTKLRQIPSSVENTSLKTYSEYTFHSFANWMEPLIGGTAPRSPCSLPSALNWICWPPPNPPEIQFWGRSLAIGIFFCVLC
jgi:hypothetical protein